MLLFNARPFGGTLRIRLHPPSRTGRCFSAPEGNGHSNSSRLALHDSGCVLGYVQSSDLG